MYAEGFPNSVYSVLTSLESPAKGLKLLPGIIIRSTKHITSVFVFVFLSTFLYFLLQLRAYSLEIKGPFHVSFTTRVG